MVEADEELVCRELHSVVNQIFSVENVIIFLRAISLHVHIQLFLGLRFFFRAHFQGFFLGVPSVKLPLSSYLDGHGALTKLLGAGGGIPSILVHLNWALRCRSCLLSSSSKLSGS